jgi:hypothetical protein
MSLQFYGLQTDRVQLETAGPPDGKESYAVFPLGMLLFVFAVIPFLRSTNKT